MICNGCDNDEFEEEDGFFYCLQCGVRADDIIATAVDDEDFVGDGRGGATYSQLNTRRVTTQPTATPSQHLEETNRYSQFRSQLKSASKITQPNGGVGGGNDVGVPTDPEDFGGGGGEEAVKALSYEDCYQQTRERYANGLIMMITYQCDALVEKFNVTPLIIGLVGPICLRFLALSGAFDQDWADNAIRDSELQSQGCRILLLKKNKYLYILYNLTREQEYRSDYNTTAEQLLCGLNINTNIVSVDIFVTIPDNC